MSEHLVDEHVSNMATWNKNKGLFSLSEEVSKSLSAGRAPVL